MPSSSLSDAGSFATLAVFALYLASTVGVGLWAARRGEDSEEDYFLAGRRLSGLTMALSAVSSGRSAWLVVGASAATWSMGLQALWMFPGYILAEAWMFAGLGPRLRARSAAVGAITVPEVLSALPLGPDGRPGSSRLPLRPLAGLLIVAFLLTYVAAQLSAGAVTLEAVFGLDGATWGLCITAGIALVYTLLGGYRAVVVTDVIQAGFMLVGLMVLPLLGLVRVGGFGALSQRLTELDPGLLDPVGSPLALIGGLCIGLGSPGNPHILVRHMSLGDPRQARIALLTGTTWNVVMAAGALLMGLVGRALYPVASAFAGGRSDELYGTLALDLSADLLFPGFAGFLLATLFAAVMSTCDSQLLVIASSFVRDLRGRPNPSTPVPAKGSRGRSRAAVAVTLLAAVALSFVARQPQVHGFVLLSWSLLGAAFGPALVLLLHDRRTSARGVLVGMLVGAGVVAAWFHGSDGRTPTYELGVAFLASLLCTLSLRHRRARR